MKKTYHAFSPFLHNSLCVSERRVLTLVTSVDSGRARASSYAGPHVWSRGPQLLPLLMFLTCSVTRREVGERWQIASCLHRGFSSMSGSLRLKTPERESLLLNAAAITSLSVRDFTCWPNCFLLVAEVKTHLAANFSKQVRLGCEIQLLFLL